MRGYRAKRNPVARALRTLRPKVKPSAKIYQRKPRIGESPTSRAIDALAATLRRECPLAELFEAVWQLD